MQFDDSSFFTGAGKVKFVLSARVCHRAQFLFVQVEGNKTEKNIRWSQQSKEKKSKANG